MTDTMGVTASPTRLTMKDIARTAGVSAMTVSNTFRYPNRVHPETREAVLTVAADLGYVPNFSAGLLAAGSSNVIGTVLPSIRNSSFYGFNQGLRRAASRLGLEIITIIAETAEDEARAVQTLLGLRVAGLVLVGGDHSPASRRLIEKSQVPVVESWSSDSHLGMSVSYDVAAASTALTQHLIDRGRRRIGFVNFSGGAEQRYSDRLPAFRKAMFDAGLADDLILAIREADGFGAGPQVVQDLLARDARLDAILCPTDIVAAGAVFECNRRRLSVPGELAVAGWGNFDVAHQLSPSLTTIAPHPDKIGENAISLLAQRIAGELTDVRRAELSCTKFELIIRQST